MAVEAPGVQGLQVVGPLDLQRGVAGDAECTHSADVGGPGAGAKPRPAGNPGPAGKPTAGGGAATATPAIPDMPSSAQAAVTAAVKILFPALIGVSCGKCVVGALDGDDPPGFRAPGIRAVHEKPR